MKRFHVLFLAALAAPLLVLSLQAATTQPAGHKAMSPATPEDIVATYDSLADAILAVNASETNVVRAILASTHGHAHAAYHRARSAMSGGDRKAASAALEELAAYVGQPCWLTFARWRRTASRLLVSSGRSSFTATLRLSEICSARNTAPIPPSPSLVWIR